MDKLKDVADYWRKVKSGELPAPGPNEISITVCTLDGAVSRIAALLAELEAKDKRIEELGRANKSQDDHINQQQDRIDSLEKTNAGLGRGLAAAEKRLAIPVRLPTTSGRLGVAYTRVIPEVIEAIRAAGFTVEGDE